MFEPTILFRRKNSRIWDLREMLDIEDAKSYVAHLAEDGHETVLLSPEAMTAFFALDSTARALVMTSVYSNRPTLEEWIKKLLFISVFLGMALVIISFDLVVSGIMLSHHPISHRVAAVLAIPFGTAITLNGFALYQVARLGRRVHAFVRESLVKMPMLNNLHPTLTLIETKGATVSA